MFLLCHVSMMCRCVEKHDVYFLWRPLMWDALFTSWVILWFWCTRIVASTSFVGVRMCIHSQYENCWTFLSSSSTCIANFSGHSFPSELSLRFASFSDFSWFQCILFSVNNAPEWLPQRNCGLLLPFAIVVVTVTVVAWWSTLSKTLSIVPVVVVEIAWPHGSADLVASNAHANASTMCPCYWTDL